MALLFMGNSAWFAFDNPDMFKLPQHGGNVDTYNPVSGGYPCYAYGCGLPVGKEDYLTVATRICDGEKTWAWATSEQFLLWFTLMFWVSVASFISVFLGCLGTCVPFYGLMGSAAHFVINWVYFVLMILGCVWRWSSSGIICTGK